MTALAQGGSKQERFVLFYESVLKTLWRPDVYAEEKPKITVWELVCRCRVLGRVLW